MSMPEMNSTKNRPICKVCNTNLAKSRGKRSSGAVTYHSTCAQCQHHKYTQFKKDRCECCGFIAVHRAQLDVDHIDGDSQNNVISNLQTLCANCHRLKTVLCKDHMTLTSGNEPEVDKQLRLVL